MFKIERKHLFRILLVLVGVSLIASGAFASSSAALTRLRESLRNTFISANKIIIGTAYVTGFGIMVSGLYKFKQHRDNPQQVPLGIPVSLVAIGALAIFFPSIVKPAGYSIFGKDASGGDVEGNAVANFYKE